MKLASRLLAASVALGLLAQSVPAQQPSTPSAPSAPLAAAAPADHRMDWWREARFGMFIHWGIYSVPAGVWKDKNYPGAAEWLMDSAKIPVAEYEPLAKSFNPVDFDAAKWVALAKSAGMKYIVITSKHHDGFCMWGTKQTRYNVVDATPFKRDVLKELAAECKKQGMKLGFYYSIMDWHHPDAKGANFPRYVEHMKAQLKELLSGDYGKVAVLWFDGEWIPEWTDALGKDMYEYVRSLDKDIVINNRVGKSRDGMAGLNKGPGGLGDFGTPEQEVPAGGLAGVDWETCMTMNGSWGFHQNDSAWKSGRDLIRTLVETASKGGNFLLNVGPTSKGEIPEESVDRLLEMGLWLGTYGQSIYGTSAFAGGPYLWGDCTVKPGALYLHVHDWPDETFVVRGLSNKVTAATLVVNGEKLKIDAKDDELVVHMPAGNTDNASTVIRLDVDGTPTPGPRVVHFAKTDTVIPLSVFDAKITGSARIEQAPDKRCLGFWKGLDDTIAWDVMFHAPGRYHVTVDASCDPDEGGGSFIIAAGDTELVGKAIPTNGWTDFTRFSIDDLAIKEPGRYIVIMHPTKIRASALMNLRGLYLQHYPERERPAAPTAPSAPKK